MTPAEDASRKGLIDNLAASIYKQGEQANAAQDYRAAADHFLRVAKAAPTSTIRPAAEYDAGAALMQLKDWAAAASVLDAFRKAYPEHELNREATKQIAFVKREEGNLSAAAAEYERVAAESDDDELAREALLEAGDLYEKSKADDRALAAYLALREPVPRAGRARARDALEDRRDVRGPARHRGPPRAAAPDRGGRRRRPAASARRARATSRRSRRSCSPQDLYRDFAEVKLRLPFERSLAGEAAAHERGARRVRRARGLRGRRRHRGRDVLHGRDLRRLQPVAARLGAPRRSRRPRSCAEYQSTLEGEAFPFEEKAIAVHEKNLELLGSGVYNPWIDKSLARLAELSPGRYAKFEASSGWIASIDSYAYRAPAQPAPGTQPPAPRSAVAGAPSRPMPPAALPTTPSPRTAQPGPAAPAPDRQRRPKTPMAEMLTMLGTRLARSRSLGARGCSRRRRSASPARARARRARAGRGPGRGRLHDHRVGARERLGARRLRQRGARARAEAVRQRDRAARRR